MACLSQVLKGSGKKRRMLEREILQEADYVNTRSVSLFIENCPPGDYIIVPTTFDPVADLTFVMRFSASATIELFDCDGGENVEVFDASDDQISKAAVPMSLTSGAKAGESAPSALPGGRGAAAHARLCLAGAGAGEGGVESLKIAFEELKADDAQGAEEPDRNRVKKYDANEEAAQFSGLLTSELP